MKLLRIIRNFLLIVSAVVVLAVAAAFIRQAYMNNQINDDISGIYTDERYAQAVRADGVPVMTQEISCGYACLEMFAQWCGSDLTEQGLSEIYDGKVVTSTGSAFEKEMNRQFPEYQTEMKKYLKNTELIEELYRSLKNGVPVVCELAAVRPGAPEGDEWTLHYVIVTGMDIRNDTVTVSNPYGYEETYTVTDFLEATRFESYENMPLFLQFAFAFGVFEKNTIFIIK